MVHKIANIFFYVFQLYVIVSQTDYYYEKSLLLKVAWKKSNNFNLVLETGVCRWK